MRRLRRYGPLARKMTSIFMLGSFLEEKKAPARNDNQEIGLDHTFGTFLWDKKAPARHDHQEIGLDRLDSYFRCFF